MYLKCTESRFNFNINAESFVVERYMAIIPIKYYPFFYVQTSISLANSFFCIHYFYLRLFICPIIQLYITFSISSITQKDQRQIKTETTGELAQYRETSMWKRNISQRSVFCLLGEIFVKFVKALKCFCSSFFFILFCFTFEAHCHWEYWLDKLLWTLMRIKWTYT